MCHATIKFYAPLGRIHLLFALWHIWHSSDCLYILNMQTKHTNSMRKATLGGGISRFCFCFVFFSMITPDTHRAESSLHLFLSCSTEASNWEQLHWRGVQWLQWLQWMGPCLIINTFLCAVIRITRLLGAAELLHQVRARGLFQKWCFGKLEYPYSRGAESWLYQWLLLQKPPAFHRQLEDWLYNPKENEALTC